MRFRKIEKHADKIGDTAKEMRKEDELEIIQSISGVHYKEEWRNGHLIKIDKDKYRKAINELEHNGWKLKDKKIGFS